MDWARWHEAYEDPDSSLSQRLAAVQQAIRDWLDAERPGPLRLVSACAGQGRDVVGALRDHPRRAEVTGLLVEADPSLAEDARRLLRGGGLTGFEVVTGDAGNSAAYAGWVPANLLMFCGVFGNVSDRDLRVTVETLPSLCAAEATVIWTRHRDAPDLTPVVRSWFTDAGMEEVSFACLGRRTGVGVSRLSVAPKPFVEGVRLFTFTR